MNGSEEDDTCTMCGSYNNRFVICDKCLAEILETIISKEAAQTLVREKIGEFLYADYYTGKPANLNEKKVSK